ncbi:MAG TPA: hypothetical protein VHO03_03605 [Ignavibacteriales bacterium]|nr:hypothetical protein [Ignavibacteriales bacterium]
MGKSGTFIMLKNSALFILFSLSFIAGCKSPNEPPSRPQTFYPLAVGNKWYYNSITFNYGAVNLDTTTVNLVEEVTGVKVIDKKNYFEVTSTDLTSGTKDTTYYRMSCDTLFEIIAKYPENIHADFSLNLNEQAYWDQDVKVTLKNDEYMTFETFVYDDSYSMTFKRGVGMINSIHYGYGDCQRTKLIKSEIK